MKDDQSGREPGGHEQRYDERHADEDSDYPEVSQLSGFLRIGLGARFYSAIKPKISRPPNRKISSMTTIAMAMEPRIYKAAHSRQRAGIALEACETGARLADGCR